MSLYGLVICGGESTRMGTDKSLLVYYQKPQYEHVADLLAPLCEHVVVCCNAEQHRTFRTSYPKLADLPRFAGAGPMTALLTAFAAFPGNDFLVAGCDYPYLTTDELANFLHYTNKDLPASAFYNQNAFYEPLLGWYSRSAGDALLNAFENGSHSLQRFLQGNSAGKYQPVSAQTMQSVDTIDDYRAVKHALEVNKDFENGNQPDNQS
ncbi:MAG: molybdenum cofactor guanylyltransferase [Dyadobacter sp. 50-39]|uniref:molybdenum cofactor guanylyltransferase n=1 Tax=Dyadobacter sp. 50-39 TaxID=1895756 RepID=UPI00095C32D7|nr:molybdenum cofactor guanylyltransferase [Dyadobacter sp. 50-39]OJV20211.1 MAG: molybdenum cofactor guanylyltransferase [Dyadobacter sp. 50-39]